MKTYQRSKRGGWKTASCLALLALLGSMLLAACGDNTATSAPATTAAANTTAAATSASATTTAAATTAAGTTTASAATTTAATGKLETVKVAHTPSILFAPLYVAIENGYFSEQGINVDLQTVQAGQDAIALAGQGQLDVVVAGLSAATFNAINRDINIKVVASMAFQPKQGQPTALMLRKSLTDSVKTIADLKGKKIAFLGGVGATGSYYLALKLKEGNLTLKDISVVNLSAADQVTALTNGSIDAALASAPFTSQLIKDGTAVPFGGQISPGVSGTAIMYSPQFAQKTDLGQRFMVAMMKGSRAVQGDNYKSQKNLDIYAKYTKTPVDTIKAIDPYDFSPDLVTDKATVENMQVVFNDLGLLKPEKTIPVEKVVDESFAKAALAKLGPFKS